MNRLFLDYRPRGKIREQAGEVEFISETSNVTGWTKSNKENGKRKENGWPNSLGSRQLLLLI